MGEKRPLQHKSDPYSSEQKHNPEPDEKMIIIHVVPQE